jgi:aminoglycoside 3-N-acetyltransferase
MKIPLPTPWKRRIKGRLKQWRLDWLRYGYAFGPEQFAAGLRQLGLKEGDTLMVSSSMDCFAAFIGRPTEIIAELEKVLGPSGTLLMPTIPFVGSALDWVGANMLFDNYRTPSQMGLLTELFRRSNGVIRSQHPTHAVAAKGLNAELLCADHHLAKTPCGKGSPYQRMFEVDGFYLLLGSGVESMVIYHAIEEIIEDKMPVSPFTKEFYTVQSRTSSGDLVTTQTRLFNPDLSRRRCVSKMIPRLKSRAGCWQQVTLGKNLDMILLKAREVLAVAEEMAARGEFCYED